MFRLVAEDTPTNDVMPRLTSYIPGLFHPSFSHDKHVAYVGFPVRPFQITASTIVHGVTLGFTIGRLPAGARLTTVQGGTARFAFECVNSTRYCEQSPSTSCNGTSTPTCTCRLPIPGTTCAGVGGMCAGSGVCIPCWQLGTCPTLEGNMTLTWVPVSGQEGVHTICFNAVAQRPANLCSGTPRPVGCDLMVSDMKCVVIGMLSPCPYARCNMSYACMLAANAISVKPQDDNTCLCVDDKCLLADVRREPAPRIWTSFEQDLDPYANSRLAYLGRPLVFKIYSNDTNCQVTCASTPFPRSKISPYDLF
jgi:hypothetical protein